MNKKSIIIIAIIGIVSVILVVCSSSSGIVAGYFFLQNSKESVPDGYKASEVSSDRVDYIPIAPVCGDGISSGSGSGWGTGSKTIDMQLKNDTGKCIASDGKTLSGDCDAGWKLDKISKQLVNANGKCLQDYGSDPSEFTCFPDNIYQKWDKKGSTLVNTGSAKCLDSNEDSVYSIGCNGGGTQNWT